VRSGSVGHGLRLLCGLGSLLRCGWCLRGLLLRGRVGLWRRAARGWEFWGVLGGDGEEGGVG
jgi:hypothetical protein